MSRKPLLPRAEYLATVPKKRVTAGVVFLNPEKSAILLVKPWYKIWWTLPGGGANPGESPRHAAQREVQEELGLTVSKLAFVGLNHLTVDGDDVIHTYFDGGIIDQERFNKLQVDPDELDECKFVQLSDLSQYATVGTFATELQNIARAIATGRPHYLEEATER